MHAYVIRDLLRARSILISLTMALLLSTGAWVVAEEQKMPAILFVGSPSGYIQPDLSKELSDKGFIIDHSTWKGLTAERLRRFNSIVLMSLGDTPAQAPWNDKFEDMLDEYMRLGGGVTTFFNDVESLCVAAKPWFGKHGLELVHMSVEDLANQQDVPRPKYVYGQTFSPADIVMPSGISAGVQALWYSNASGGYSNPSAIPLLVDANWTPVVQSRPNSIVRYRKGHEVLESNVKLELDGKVGSWNLVATRKIGNGRMVAIGLRPIFYVWAPLFDKFDSVQYRKGLNGIPSNFDVLLENSLRWTAEPSLASGTLGWKVGLAPPTTQGDTAPINWKPKAFTAAGPWFRGHVGAQTAFSGGEGTVAEWVAAAKKEGLSFLVFLEDMSAMDAEKWEDLKGACKAASGTDFRCYPGMRYRVQIASGGTNHCFVIDGRGKLPWPLKRFFLPNNDLSIREQEDQAPYFMAFNTTTTAGFMRHGANTTPYWDYKLHGLFSVLAHEDGKMVDDAMDLYREQMPANVSSAPVGIDLVKRPSQLADVVSSGRPLLVVNGAYDPRYPQQSGGLAQVDLHVGSMGEQGNPGFGMYRGWFGPTVTEGPSVSMRFRGGYTYKGVEYPRYWIERYSSVEDQDWFMPSYHRLPVRLEVSSLTPLEEVTVSDGTNILFRFDVQGKTEFLTEFVIPQDRNRHLIAYAKDAKGRRAITMEIWTEQQQQLYNYCGDHINAPLSRGAEPGHGNAWTEGFLKMSPACNTVAAAYPRSIAGTGFESRRYELDMVSPDVWLERSSSDRYFPKLLPHMSNPWHNWSEPVIRDDVRHQSLRQEWYQLHGRNYRHHGQDGIHWDGYLYHSGDETPKKAYYAMQTLSGETLKEVVPHKAYGFVPGLSQVLWEGNLAAEAIATFTIVRPDGKNDAGDFTQLMTQGGLLVGDLPTGSAIVLGSGFTARIQGSSLGYALQVVKAKDANKRDVLQANLRVAPRSAATVIPAGSRYVWSFETIALSLAAPLSLDNSWMSVASGTVTDHWVGATLAADHGQVHLTLGKQPLPVNSTPLTINKINPNWTCGFLDRKALSYRPVGVTAQGTAYVQVDARQEGIEVVIGNVLVCDQPELRIFATQDTDADGRITGSWTVDVHNPTKQAITSEIAANSGFEALFLVKSHKTTVSAGSTVRLHFGN